MNGGEVYSRMVNCWVGGGAVWLFSGVMTRVSTKAYMNAESITEYREASNLSIIDEGVLIVLIIVAGTLVNTIARNQETW